jgi:hypothetical protein
MGGVSCYRLQDGSTLLVPADVPVRVVEVRRTQGQDVNDRVAGLKRHGEALYEESRELMIDFQKAFQRRAP